jgi:hypothetical protein
MREKKLVKRGKRREERERGEGSRLWSGGLVRV